MKASSLKGVEVLKDQRGRESVYVSGVHKPELIPTEFIEVDGRKGKELVSLYNKKK